MGKTMTLIVACVAVAITAMAAVYMGGPVRSTRWPDLKIVMRLDEKTGGGWNIREDVALFSMTFATVHHPHDMLNDAEARELAKAVAVTIARHLGSTNAVRVAHYEYPKPAGSNLVECLNAWINAKDVTDEVIQL